MQGGLREWTAVEESAGGGRWQKLLRFMYLLVALAALWAFGLYITGDGSLGEFLLRALLVVAFLIPVFRARQQFTIKANDEAVFLPGAFRWHRVPWSQVSEVRLDTPEAVDECRAGHYQRWEDAEGSCRPGCRGFPRALARPSTDQD